MGKQVWKPSTLLYPVPVVMVTCADTSGRPNIITVAWAGTVNSEPPMLSISVRKERYSHGLILEKGQFAVNLVTEKLVFAADYCGVRSGRDTDKFAAVKLTPEKASKIDVPLIGESPVSIECEVVNRLKLGSHDVFIGKIAAVNVEEGLLDGKGGLHLDEAGLVCYSHGEYWNLGKSLGYFGYSVNKKKRIRDR